MKTAEIQWHLMNNPNVITIIPDKMKPAEEKFNKAMTALLLEVDESIINNIREIANNMKKEHAIKFGVWVQENQGKENFDFNRSDTDGWYELWINSNNR